MTANQVLAYTLPVGIRNAVQIWRSKHSLRRIPSIPCSAERLRRVEGFALQQIWQSEEVREDWAAIIEKSGGLGILNLPGGVNPGDRRAIYYLVRNFHPESVLEVGTHVGASTMYIALAMALQTGKSDGTAPLTTVDIHDVNSEDVRPWLKYGVGKSPVQMLRDLHIDSLVRFATADSLEFGSSCQKRFDFIFLDGDHSAARVYKEIPMALRLLNADGVILLHDYFPELRPLWSNKRVISGPYLAVQRLIQEGANLQAVPLGELPWQTKCNSNTTSLALLLRKAIN